MEKNFYFIPIVNNEIKKMIPVVVEDNRLIIPNDEDVIDNYKGKKDVLLVDLNNKTNMVHTTFELFAKVDKINPYKDFLYDIEYFVKGYSEKMEYESAVFSFDELNNLMQPLEECKRLGDAYRECYTLQPVQKKKIDDKVELMNRKCNITINCKKEMNKEPYSEIEVNFEKCKDYDFFIEIYNLIKAVFSIIFYRQNISCNSFVLRGKHVDINKDEDKYIDSTVIYYDIYDTEKIKEEKVSKKWLEKIDILFINVANFISEKTDNIFPWWFSPRSIRERYYIDAGYFLGKTASFEANYRYNISKDSYNKELKRILEDLLNSKDDNDKNIVSGRARADLKYMIKQPLKSLETKINEAFNGSSDIKWDGVKEYFEIDGINENDVEIYAKEINIMRNEFAHDKRENVLTDNTLIACRFIEKMNYVIFLKQLGYNKESIIEITRSIF